MSVYRLLVVVGCVSWSVFGADLPPDKSGTIPQTSLREVVTVASSPALALPKHELPDGLELQVVAARPLVTFPIMGCVDDRGRLFVGDAVGVNWNRAQLEANPPNRVLMLEDRDADGVYDRSTVFADKMTFPQGACWLDGSLYVCSPPGLWKLTDKDGDGVAEERRMIVGGFDYTGNAADVHGPFLHPNGRLYWCHGRKGHKVVQQDGTLVHEGLASGIWSCKPDGADVQWHSLGCADNPVEVDFTPEGELIGTVNLYYSQPRGDTLVHWLYGGVYERADQLTAIAGLPRTLQKMPVMHNFGHVAVSGACFAKSGVIFGDGLHYLVTHFNTQRVVHMELIPDGSTYRAVEHEFLRFSDRPDVHFTDVIEDRDGSLLVLDGGGWFRIGCPASLMEKNDLWGAVYRVKKKAAQGGGVMEEPRWKFQKEWKPTWEISSAEEAIKQLQMKREPRAVRAACDWIAENPESMPYEEWSKALVSLLHEEMDAAMEHSVMNAGICAGGLSLDDLKEARSPMALRRMFPIHAATAEDAAGQNLALGIAFDHYLSDDEALADAAMTFAKNHPDVLEFQHEKLLVWLKEKNLTVRQQEVLETLLSLRKTDEHAQPVIRVLLSHPSAAVRLIGLRASIDDKGAFTDEAAEVAGALLTEAKDRHLTELLQMLARTTVNRFDPVLLEMVGDATRPSSIRMKALSVVAGRAKETSGEAFALLTSLLLDPVNLSARLEAARALAAVKLNADQVTQVAALFPRLGPLELAEMLKLARRTTDHALLKTLAESFAAAPAIGSLQESDFRTLFATKGMHLFGIVQPALNAAADAAAAKRQRLQLLAGQAVTADAEAGKRHFVQGKGTCIACHKVGALGRALGPDLTKIGAIRNERDLLESILFPSNTLARDYEAHSIETSDGRSVTGVIRSHTAEGLMMMDLGGAEHLVPHDQVVSHVTLTTSLMPMGLDQTLPENELLELVAYFRSLK